MLFKNRKGSLRWGGGILSASLMLGLSVEIANGAERVSFNDEWRFSRFGLMADGTQQAEPQGLEKPATDDSTWRRLNLPHDWGIEGPFRMALPNSTGKLPWVGIGWYRKTFQSLAADQGKWIFIDFDGAMSCSEVWLNGERVGGWPYGYSSFRLELTDHIRTGEENVLAVRLDNKLDSSRWYPGGGIYRNVWLVKTSPVHVAHWGIFATTPEVSEECATIRIKARIDGATDETEVLHEIVGTGLNAKGTNCTITIDSPRLWGLDSPYLYTLKTTVRQKGEVVDTVETPVGIRSIEYTADRGFLLNGKVVKMNGVCQHHDLGPLGTAINTRALERQIEILQEMGCNAIRTSHNPSAPELLDLCDRMGMLVQVEAFDCWAMGKTANDYGLYFPEWHEKDLQAMVRRDRNHPSVVMWSIGNEIREQKRENGSRMGRELSAIIRAEDPTRPTTTGCNIPASGTNGFQRAVDLFGYNYKPHLYKMFHEVNPDIPLYGSETASCISSRGEYFFPVLDDISKGAGGFFQVSSYDLSAPRWATLPDAEFEAQDRYPFLFGEFVWTGFDYIGEPTPYNKDKTNLLNFPDPADRKKMEDEMERLGKNIPPRSSYFGIVDLCGFPKDRFYLYQARWRPELPMAHILPHWNWPERIGKTTPVHVYTSGNEAELFLNGKSLGRKKKGPFEYRLRWDDVIYQPGELQVVAYKDGEKWAEDQVETTGEAALIELAADREILAADGRDLSFITVRVVDENGQEVPRSHNAICFRIEGSGELAATGNGDPTDHESFQSLERKIFNGRCLLVVRTKKGEAGSIRILAESDGLAPCRIILETTL